MKVFLSSKIEKKKKKSCLNFKISLILIIEDILENNKMIKNNEETDTFKLQDKDNLKHYQKILIIYIQIIILIPFLILYYKYLLSALRQNLLSLMPQLSTQFFFNIANLYWKGILNRKSVFSIKSFLYHTKTKWKVNLWTGNGTTFIDDAERQLNILKVQIKPFIFENEIKNTPFEVFKMKYPWEYNRKFFRAFNIFSIEADWIRIILLYNYGGLYFDLDTLFIKPPEDMIAKHKQFVSPWGTGSFKNTNNNLIYLSRENIIKLSESAIREKKPANIMGLSFLSYENLKKNNIDVLSLCECDACWGCSNFSCKFHFIFQKKTKKNQIIMDYINENSFLYHWHNGYNRVIDNNSYFDELEKKFNEKLIV